MTAPMIKLCVKLVFILRIPPLKAVLSNIKVFIVWDDGIYENIETALDFNYMRLWYKTGDVIEYVTVVGILSSAATYPLFPLVKTNFD